MIFDQLEWRPDRMLYQDLVFRLEHYRSDDWDGGDHFAFYKIKGLVDQYERYFQDRARPLEVRNVLELGMWDGGSIAFWFENFQPRKHVALDLLDRTDSPYFLRYRDSRGYQDRIATHWKTDQSDKARLREIVAAEFDGPLDFIIDDASHLYGPSRASFEALFPLLRPGGIYVLEDWAWDHWKEFHDPGHAYAYEVPLTRLVFDLVETIGSVHPFIHDINVRLGFAVIERGPGSAEEVGELDLDQLIVRRPNHPRPWENRWYRLRKRLGLAETK